MDNPFLDVIMVTYNRLDYTQRTISSLYETIKSPFRLILIDNNSSEEGFGQYLTQLSLKCANCFIIRNESNIGWGAAVNMALNHSSASFVLLSNNDVIYNQGWYEECLGLYEQYGIQIGIMGLWKHIGHNVLEDRGNLLIKDNMPAVAWLLKKSFININGKFLERGPCGTKGGNGEDVDYCQRAITNGYWVCGPKNDLAQHITGY